jgi:hypothetical protein
VLVCQVDNIISDKELLVTWWLPDDFLPNALLIENRQPLILSEHNNEYKCKFLEVTMLTSSQSVLEISSVVDVAFVFHAQTLENHWVNCAGMDKVRFTRFLIDSNNCLVEIHPNDYLPFRLNVPESYPSRLWYSIIMLKEKLSGILNQKAQQRKASLNLFFPLESWTYLCRQFLPILLSIDFIKVKSKPYQYCDLSLITKSSAVQFSMLRTSNPCIIERARKIFGVTCGIGCRNLPPSKGEVVRKIQHGDNINVVDINSPKNVAQNEVRRFEEFIPA